MMTTYGIRHNPEHFGLIPLFLFLIKHPPTYPPTHPHITKIIIIIYMSSSFSLCKYKNILGKPNEGIHSIRIANIAVVDVVMTVIGAFIIHRIINRYLPYSFFFILFILFLLGIILHYIFCVPTTINKIINQLIHLFY